MVLAIGAAFDRYLVLDLVGEGGMGAVYRARDPRLDRDVALKVLRLGASEDPQGAARLVREARAAAALNHPNAVAVYDAGTFDGHPFIAMELIAGKPLRAFVGDASLPMGKRVRWIAEIAMALAAAHEGGLVHRDIKPENVMVRDDGVLKVLDFGIARRFLANELDTITQDGAVVGTPLYMAPEQIQAQAIDPRADQFSWAVVAYELLTGVRPWAENAATYRAIAEILTHQPLAPSARAADVPAHVEAVLLRALAKQPAQRFATMRDVVLALEGNAAEAVSTRAPTKSAIASLVADVHTPEPSATPIARKPARARARRVAAVGTIAALAIAAASARLALPSSKHAPPVAPALAAAPTAAEAPVAALPIEVRRAVAILGFQDVRGSKDDAWHGAAIAELLDTELAAGGRLRTVPGDRVARARVELGLQDTRNVSPEMLARVRENLGVDLVVAGSILTLDAKRVRSLQLQVALLDAKTGATIASVVETGTEEELFPLVARIGRALRATLGMPEPAPDQAARAATALPVSAQAARMYAEALVARNQFRDRDALALLTKVTALAPDFALAHAHAAAAMMQIGDDEKAKEEASRARDLGTNLPREERLWIEAVHHFTQREWLEAARTYQALFTFYPDDIEYGLMQAQMLTKGVHPKEALAVIALLKKLPPPLSDDPRIEYEEARAGHTESDYPACLRSALVATKKAEAHGNRIVVSQSGYFHGIALINLGRVDEGLGVLLSSKALARDLGDVRTAGILEAPIANTYIARGELDRARAEVAESRETLLTLGNTYYAMAAYDQLGVLDVEKGELAAGRARIEEAIAHYRASNSLHALSGSLPAMAVIMTRMGDPTLAAPLAEETLRITQGSGRKTAETSAELALGLIARTRGDLNEARRHQERALDVAKHAQLESGVARALDALGETSRQAGDPAAARKELEEALALRVKLGEQLRANETRVALARVALDEGRAADAESLARESAAFFERIGASASRASALGVLARAIAATQPGRFQEANVALVTAERLAPGDTAMHLALRIAAARVRSAEGDSAGARRLLEAAVHQAERVHHDGAALEARALLTALAASVPTEPSVPSVSVR